MKKCILNINCNKSERNCTNAGERKRGRETVRQSDRERDKERATRVRECDKYAGARQLGQQQQQGQFAATMAA